MSFDLHCHTKISDGSSSIDEVIALAKKIGLQGIAITDHDTLAGSTRAAVLGKRAGLEVLTGVEISGLDCSRRRKAHILCYEPQNPDRLLSILKKISDSRRKAMMISIQKIMRLYPISLEMVLRRSQGSTNLFKQHVMMALMDCGYTDELFGELFRKLFSSKIGLASSHIDYPDVFDIIEEVHAAGGAAVLAHPSEYEGMDLLAELCERKLIDGIEAYHPQNREEDCREILRLADKYSLPVTGGSDFHGFYTRQPRPLGTCSTTADQVVRLRKAAKKYQN